MQNDSLQVDGLRVIAPTDRRAFDDWAYDDDFCHQLLRHVASPQQPGRVARWRQAIQRYWRDKCSRRELADELGITVEAIKSLLTLIRKAAEKFRTDGHAGFKSSEVETVEWPGRIHSTITANDIYRIAGGDREAIAHAEEYGRLTLLYQLRLFDPSIAPQLEEMLEIDAADIAKANALKASVAKDDPFAGRPMFQAFQPRQPNYHADGRGRPRRVKEQSPADTLPVAHRRRNSLEVTRIKSVTNNSERKEYGTCNRHLVLRH